MDAPQQDLRITVDAWAEIVVDNWMENIRALGIGLSGQLEDNIFYSIEGSHGAHNLPTAVTFEFPFYGRFVDMGVGKGVPLEDVGSGKSDLRAGFGGHNRRPKKWYSKNMYAQSIRLGQILAERHGRLAVLAVVNELNTFDYLYQ